MIGKDFTLYLKILSDERLQDTAALGRPSMSLKITPGTVFDQPRESFSVYTGNMYYMVDNTD